jgi:hypothetical protein
MAAEAVKEPSKTQEGNIFALNLGNIEKIIRS